MFTSTSADPAVNLAAEELLFSTVGPEDAHLHLYVNRRSVVLGKHQNPWKECAVTELRRGNVDIVRRISGGGTVFHDPGNVNFSFLMDRELFDKQQNLLLVVRALARLDIPAEATPRGDILVQGKKVSGNAMALKRSRVMHHGTLLVSSDLSSLRSSSAGWADRIETHAVASNPFPVVNLGDLYPQASVGSVEEAVRQEFMETWGAAESVEDILTVVDRDELASRSDNYRTWQWNFGRTPSFTARLPFPGEEGIAVRVEEGTIRSLSGCCESPGCIVHDILTGSSFDSRTIGDKCRDWLEHDVSGTVSGGCSEVQKLTRHELVAALAGFVESMAF